LEPGILGNSRQGAENGASQSAQAFAASRSRRYRRDLSLRQGTCLPAETTIHWLKFVDFVPASDVLLRGKLADECQKAVGIKFSLETIEGNGIQARITSAVQSGTGPDIIMAINNWPQLYAESVADVSDVAEGIGKSGNGYYETARP
jgi:multiple sugar transport system substrate-binding protein